MLWISSKPPHYVWCDDLWRNENNGIVYTADIENLKWVAVGEDNIPFPPKTKICKVQKR